MLGEFSNTASMLRKQGKYYDMVGVVRQPATPVPSKVKSDKQFFPSSSRSNLNHRQGANLGHSSSSEKGGNSSVTQSKSSASDSYSAYKNDVRNKSNHSSAETKNASGSHGAQTGSSASGELHSGRTSLGSSNNSRKSDQKQENVSGGDHKPVGLKSRKLPESSHTKREPAVVPNKTQQTMREPVLQSMKQELMVQPKTNQQSQSQSEHTSASKDSERKQKVPDNNVQQSTESRTVLKVKEENRNGAVVNGAKQKNRPTLNIVSI